ncbi:capsular exopolysaccharide family [Flavobacterium glycines]|uniref:non-specific protein-tyrosine kinase n=1 Tax=Flavobacterium glycines TaxID=551990 RepID=A0A1B9DHA9_9FLAO|nr:tyrosine-protein kinase family protein [Flavobacterium glycines]OCB69073.1 tyrosine protein kinase [Flavobacterium glycines]GEL12001.1 tyrosine protein kinase [Flavobacterium glycines]SDJ53720.1 capsular exopolysaccharide family [Flavobacterium glycines]
MENNNMQGEDFGSDFDLKAEINKYLAHWKWVVLSVLICLVLAFLKLRYTVPVYNASTKILMKDTKKGGRLSEAAAFSDLGFNTGTRNVDDEIEIMKSRSLSEAVVKKLNFNVAIITKGKVLDLELFEEQSPIVVHFINQTPDFDEQYMKFDFSDNPSGTFTLAEENGLIAGKRQFRYGEAIKTKYGDLIITKSSHAKEASLGSLSIVVSPLKAVAAGYRGRLVVEPLVKGSNVVVLSIVDGVEKKAEKFLDCLVQAYNQNAVADKEFISKNTSVFVSNRLALISKELSGVEQDVERFKVNNKLTDLETEVGLYVAGSTEYNKKAVDLQVQLNVLNSIVDYVRKSSNENLLPANLLSDLEGDASALIGSYNDLVLERSRLLKSASETNPTVVKIDQELSSLKSTLLSSLGKSKAMLQIQKKDIEANENLFNGKIQKIPSQERQFREIERQQKVKEELYLYLLQKREETALALSSTEPNAKVIDEALSTGPVTVRRSVVFLGALLLGLLIPIGIIFLIDFLDTKIKSRLDLEGRTQIPFIGDVPTSEDASSIMQAESRTSSAEALRIIRTNLEFMLSKVPDGIAKTIFLTSTFPKEGKTFVSVNLAATFALSGKRVLLVGMDIRNPKLDEYLTLPDRGFTNYLSSKDLNLDDLIIKQKGYEDFHILPAGVIPPNPAELLMSKKVDSFFETVKKQYDYIIVDTAPVSLVTDTLLIAKHADTFIYVARANFLEKRMLDIPNNLHRDQKLPNMCMLLNDTDSTKGYGYGYGYGVKVENKPWYKRTLKI